MERREGNNHKSRSTLQSFPLAHTVVSLLLSNSSVMLTQNATFCDSLDKVKVQPQFTHIQTHVATYYNNQQLLLVLPANVLRINNWIIGHDRQIRNNK